MTPEQINLLRRIDRRGRAHSFALWALFAWLCLLTGLVWGQDAPRRVMSPELAVREALADATSLASVDPAFPVRMRWVMVNQPTAATRAVLSFAANTALLHGPDPWRPLPLASGAVFRLDLAEYAAYDNARLGLLLDTWDRMQDTQFYLPTDERRNVPSPPFVHGGKRWTSRSVRVVVPAPHADVGGQLTQLIQLTGSAAPIISLGQFLRFTMNSDAGGLYPEFRQFDLAPERGTDEEAFLARADVKLENLSARNADMRVLLTRKPTAGVGFIEAVPTAGAQLPVGPTATFITRDYFYGDVDAGVHPFENLLDRRHDATEIFLPTAAGGYDYALFNGQGRFVRSAPLNPPQTVASDRTVPAPHPPILQAPSSCIRCHIQDNPDTRLFGILQRAPNYVTAWRTANLGTDAAGQPVRWDVLFNQGKAGNDLERVVSLFKGDMAEVLPWAGRTYSRFVFAAAGAPLEEAVRATMSAHDEWLYSYVTPKDAVLTLGWVCATDEQARQLFNQLVPFAAEPNRLMLLRSWGQPMENGAPLEQKMTIDDWLSLYPEVALRRVDVQVQDPVQNQDQNQDQNQGAER